VFLLDGSSLELEPCRELLRGYPPAENQHGRSHWPVLRMAVLHDAETGSLLRSLPVDKDVSDLTWSADGNLLAAACRDGNTRIWNTQNGELRTVMQGHDAPALGLAFSPDGQWLLYMVWPDNKGSGPVRIMRASPSGGSGDAVLEAKGSFAMGLSFSVDGEQDAQNGGARSFPDFRCPSSETVSCVLAEADPEEILFTFFDAVNGRRSEAARVRAAPAKFFWDLSPDGSQLAYGEFKSEENDSITILTPKDGVTRQVQLVGQSALSSLSWAAAGRGLFVTTKRREGSDLLYVGLDGKISLLREETGRVFVSPRPSPNGRFLAFAVRTTDSNVWLLETK